MLHIFPIGILLLTGLALHIIRLLFPKFSYSWLVSTIISLTVWPIILLARYRPSSVITLPSWMIFENFAYSPLFQPDEISWGFSLALITFLLSALLIDAAQGFLVGTNEKNVPGNHHDHWISSLILSAMGLLSVLAGELITLILSWSAFDFIELLFRMKNATTRAEAERSILKLSTRVIGTFFTLVAFILMKPGIQGYSFQDINPWANLMLILAAGIRLGILPLYPPIIHQQFHSPGLNSLLNIIPASSSLLLLTRIAQNPLPPNSEPYLLIFIVLAGLYGALSWVKKIGASGISPYFILGIATFAMAASVLGKTQSTYSWSLTLIFSGGIIFLQLIRNHWLLILSFLGFIGFSSIPYTPAWASFPLLSGFSDYELIFVFLFLLIQAILIAGYSVHLRKLKLASNVERWIWTMYITGLVLLLVSQWITTIPFWQANKIEIGAIPFIYQLLSPMIVLSLAGFISFIYMRTNQVASWSFNRNISTISLTRFYRLFWNSFRWVSQQVNFIDKILEGAGGILWMILILSLLFSILAYNLNGG